MRAQVEDSMLKLRVDGYTLTLGVFQIDILCADCQVCIYAVWRSVASHEPHQYDLVTIFPQSCTKCIWNALSPSLGALDLKTPVVLVRWRLYLRTNEMAPRDNSA